MQRFALNRHHQHTRSTASEAEGIIVVSIGDLSVTQFDRTRRNRSHTTHEPPITRIDVIKMQPEIFWCLQWRLNHTRLQDDHRTASAEFATRSKRASTPGCGPHRTCHEHRKQGDRNCSTNYSYWSRYISTSNSVSETKLNTLLMGERKHR